MNKKLLSALLAVSVIAVLVIAAAGAFAMTPEEEEEAWKKEPDYGRVIRVGYDTGLCTSTLGLAHAKGFYKAEGIDTEIVRFQGQTTVQGDALGTGKTDISGGHIATMLVPAANGVRYRFTTGMHSGCKTLYVLASSDIKTTKDLVGKTVIITTPIGGSDNNIAMRFFLRDGLDPVKDFKYKQSDSGAGVMAVQSGEAATVMLTDQFAQKFVDQGILRPIRSLTFDDDFNTETCCIVAISQELVERSPITAKKLTRAHEKTRQWLMENREEAVQINLDNKWASGKFEDVLRYYKTLDYSISDKNTGETLRKVIDDYKTCGILTTDRSTDEILSQVWVPLLDD